MSIAERCIAPGLNMGKNTPPGHWMSKNK